MKKGRHMSEQPKTPNRKVGAGALAGAVMVVGVFTAEQLGTEIPPEVASAMTTILTFGVSYLVHN